MKKRKDFYKQWHDEKKAIFQRVAEENSTLSNAERREEDDRSKMEFQRILAKAEEAEKHAIYFRIPFRKKLFARLVKHAMLYAEESGADITYETTEAHGFLRLEMDQVILDDMRPQHWKVWRRLIRYADTFWVDPIEKYSDPALQFTFFVDFQKRIGMNIFR